MENGTTKRVIQYLLTPQVMPRIQTLFFTGFSHVAYFMAQIYRSARLLPPEHPYLLTANMGKYGIRHVIAEAGNNLVISRRNIDQVLIFGILLIGMVLLLMQIGLLGFSFLVEAAWAGGIPTTFAGYYLVPDATHDVAFVILDRVFGLNAFFTDVGGGTTCVAQNIPCFDIGQSTREISPDLTVNQQVAPGGGFLEPVAPVDMGYPLGFHTAMHRMFEAYSIGLLLVAVFIFIYFATAVVAETAQSGTPFGRRFNHVWAPLRIVAAMGMLVPLPNTYAESLNSAQYILLYAAKWGSGFATNGWILFNQTAIEGGGTMLGETETLVASPNAPPINTLLEFFTIVATCKVAYEHMYHERVDREPVIIDAWLVNPENLPSAELLTDNALLEDALDFFNNGDIVVRFGEKSIGGGPSGGPERSTPDYQTYDGSVIPYCGEVMLNVTDVDQATNPGAYWVLEYWYILLQTLWTAASVDGGAGCDYGAVGAGGVGDFACVGYNVSARYLPIFNDPAAPLPTSGHLDTWRTNYEAYIETTIELGVEEQAASPEWLEQLTVLGWGGAAIWYNKVAQLNGALIGAVQSLPTVKLYPSIMEDVRRRRANANADMTSETTHQVFQGPDADMQLLDDEEVPIGKALYLSQKIWTDHYAEKQKGGNIWIDAVNMIFGTEGLFAMQENMDNNIHPLAQLVAVGRSIIDTAIRNLGFSAAAGLGGGILNLFNEHMAGRVAMTASGFLSQIATIGLSIGFVLFYVVPFLPFIYFFFAVGGWIKALFEAMVGVPLWALAHIRIDGNGLPGDAALGGYHLILEIFLRPILICFGFLASITIFSAQVRVLHEIWPIVVSNTSGFDVEATAGYNPDQTGGIRFLRGALDKFFYTVIYAIVVYMLAMSSFKLIDMIPNHILRWIGANVSSFGDQAGDPAQNLVRNSYIGANMMSGQIQGAVGSMKGAAGSGAQAIAELTGRSS